MKCSFLVASVFALLALSSIIPAATFSYHGVLQDAGKPADGKYDIELTLFAGPNQTNVIGGPVTVYSVDVQEGSFATDVDFGPLSKTFTNAYVGVRVRSAGFGNFVPLGTSQAITDTNTSCPGSWSLDGNAGNAAGSYLGTADTQDLVLRADGHSVLNGSGTVAYAVALSGAVLNSTSGQYSTAISNSFAAKGAYSFAAGYSAATSYSGSFVWGDQASPLHPIADSAPNQFVVQAGGGTSLNGTPVNPAVELSIFPHTGDTVSNVYLGPPSSGVLLSGKEVSQSDIFTVDSYSASGSSVVQNNLATFTDHTSGASIASYGLTVGASHWNDASGVPGGAYLTLVDPSRAHGLQISGQSNGNTADFYVEANTTTSGVYGSDPLLQIYQHDLTIYGNASKPGGGAWLNSSDRRIKQNVRPISSALETLLKLRPVTFEYTADYRAMEGGLPEKTYAGFVAQEFAEVFPEAVSQTRQRVPGSAPGDSPILALDSSPAIVTAIAGVQELAIDKETKDAEIDELRSQVAALAARLSALERSKGN